MNWTSALADLVFASIVVGLIAFLLMAAVQFLRAPIYPNRPRFHRDNITARHTRAPQQSRHTHPNLVRPKAPHTVHSTRTPAPVPTYREPHYRRAA
ncbi:hypothetical protein [Gordonia malaquae]|uniref:hypothetical protein n=1 Tax=Gordonia malaquae TaxID=410332 RepID=UPI0030159191